MLLDDKLRKKETEVVAPRVWERAKEKSKAKRGNVDGTPQLDPIEVAGFPLSAKDSSKKTSSSSASHNRTKEEKKEEIEPKVEASSSDVPPLPSSENSAHFLVLKHNSKRLERLNRLSFLGDDGKPDDTSAIAAAAEGVFPHNPEMLIL